MEVVHLFNDYKRTGGPLDAEVFNEVIMSYGMLGMDTGGLAKDMAKLGIQPGPDAVRGGRGRLGDEEEMDWFEGKKHKYSQKVSDELKHHIQMARQGDYQALLSAFGDDMSLLRFNLLLEAYSKQGLYEEMKQVMVNMRDKNFVPDAFTFAVWIWYYTRAERSNTGQVLAILKQMGALGVKPNRYSFHCLMGYFARMGQREKMLELYGEMKKSNILPTENTFWILVGSWNQVPEVMKELKQDMVRNGIDPHSLAMRMEVDPKVVFTSIAQMETQGIPVNLRSVNRLLYTMASSASFLDMQEVFESLDSYKIPPNSDTYKLLMQKLLNPKFRNFSKLLYYYQMLKKQGIRPDGEVLQIMFSALSGNDVKNPPALQEVLEDTRAFLLVERRPTSKLLKTILQACTAHGVAAQAEKLIEGITKAAGLDEETKHKLALTKARQLFMHSGFLEGMDLLRTMHAEEGYKLSNCNVLLHSLFQRGGQRFFPPEMAKQLESVMQKLKTTHLRPERALHTQEVAAFKDIFNKLYDYFQADPTRQSVPANHEELRKAKEEKNLRIFLNNKRLL